MSVSFLSRRARFHRFGALKFENCPFCNDAMLFEHERDSPGFIGNDCITEEICGALFQSILDRLHYSRVLLAWKYEDQGDARFTAYSGAFFHGNRNVSCRRDSKCSDMVAAARR